MALIQCPNCGKQISDKALNCPHCSTELKQNSKTNTNNLNEKNNSIYWIISIISIIAGIAVMPSGIIMILAGIIISPIFNNYIGKKYNINLSKNILISIYIALVIFTSLLFNEFNKDESKPNNIANGDDVNNTGTISNVNTENAKKDEVKYTDIKEFEYTINGTSLKLTSYEGHEKTVKISSTYTINNKTYTVTELENSIFNSTGVNKVYFPKTISSVTDNLLAYLSSDHIDIYYEGTEAEWNSIFTIYKASSVSDAYHSGNATDVGIALADKINSWVGHEYDASKFTYHYSASLQDVKD